MPRILVLRLLITSAGLGLWLPIASAQVSAVDNPIFAAQVTASRPSAPLAGARAIGATIVDTTTADPIFAAQVLAAAERVFPNLSAELDNAKLLRKAATDPIVRGSLRGRIAEEDWINRNAKDGWKPVKSPNAPQNDAFRFVNGRLEGAQVKVHANWHNYIRSMEEDHRSERFVLPDDHFVLVSEELESRRIGALRGGIVDKAEHYARQQQRLTKMGRTFAQVDGAIGSAAKHYERIATAIRAGGKAASFVGIALSLLDGGIAVVEVATGKAEVAELVTKLSKAAVGGAASWAIGDVVAGAATSAGATGALPVAVAIVMATGTYVVIDWAFDQLTESLKVACLNADDVKRIWPAGARGVPLDRLYKKPHDPGILLE